MSASGVYVNSERTVLVRIYHGLDGEPIVEVATREDADAIWGPPVRVERES